MTVDDRELRRALALLADDTDPAADIAGTVRARLRRRERVHRTLAVGALAAAVVATITVASVVGAPGRGDPAPVGAAPSSAPAAASTTSPSAEKTPPASSGATAIPSTDGTPPAAASTPDGERINQVFISCYATPDIGNPDFRNYLGITAGGGAGTATEALDMCTRLWTEGTLVGQPPYVLDQPSNPQDPVVPELVPCVRAIPATPGYPEVPTHEIVVLPGDPGICGRLGLDTPSG